jgi:hypothetical protein
MTIGSEGLVQTVLNVVDIGRFFVVYYGCCVAFQREISESGQTPEYHYPQAAQRPVKKFPRLI